MARQYSLPDGFQTETTGNAFAQPNGFVDETGGAVAAGPPPQGATVAALTSVILTAWALAVTGARNPGQDPYYPRQLNPSITAVQVDAPPVNSEALPYSILASWPQPSWPSQSSPKFITGQSVDAPPPLVRQQLAQLAWPQPAWPTQKEPPFIPGESVDTPPIAYYAALENIIAMWAPSARLPGQDPYYPRLLNASLTAVQVDNPPPFVRQPIQWPSVTWSAQVSAPNAAAQAIAVAQQPYTRPPVIWQPAVWWPAQSAPQNPNIAAVREDSPPPLMRQQIVWPPVTWPAQSAADIASALPPAVQQTPFTARQIALVWPLQNWPAQRSPLNASVAAVQVDVPPVLVRQALQWPQVGWPAQTAAPNAAALATPSAVAQPFARSPLAAILAWSQSQSFVPQPRTSVASLPGASVDQPPPYVRQLITWPVVTWPAQSWPRFIAGQSVDQPPLLVRRQVDWPQTSWSAQAAVKVAATILPPVVSPFLPFVRRQLALLWPQASWPAQSALKSTPLVSFVRTGDGFRVFDRDVKAIFRGRARQTEFLGVDRRTVFQSRLIIGDHLSMTVLRNDPERTQKRTTENPSFKFKFSKFIDPGVTVTQITGVDSLGVQLGVTCVAKGIITGAAAIVVTNPVMSGSDIVAQFGGGTALEDYDAFGTALMSDGQTLTICFVIEVRDPL